MYIQAWSYIRDGRKIQKLTGMPRPVCWGHRAPGNEQLTSAVNSLKTCLSKVWLEETEIEQANWWESRHLFGDVCVGYASSWRWSKDWLLYPSHQTGQPAKKSPHTCSLQILTSRIKHSGISDIFSPICWDDFPAWHIFIFIEAARHLAQFLKRLAVSPKSLWISCLKARDFDTVPSHTREHGSNLATHLT